MTTVVRLICIKGLSRPKLSMGTWRLGLGPRAKAQEFLAQVLEL